MNCMNNPIKLAFCKMAKIERMWTVKGSLLMRNAIMTMPDAVICSINTFGFLGHIALTISFGEQGKQEDKVKMKPMHRLTSA